MLSHKYSVSGHIKEKATDLLKKSYATKFFKHRAEIGVLAGCCLIHFMKQNNLYVTIVDLCKKLKCTKKIAFKYAKFLRAYLKKNPPVERVRSETEEMTFETKLDFSTRAFLESVKVENKDVLIKKTTALTKLAHACWLISGRSPEGVICACAFLCWKSMNPSCQNLSFKQFCMDFSIPYSKGLLRVAEIKNMLLKLGEKIPTLSKNYVTKKNVLFHLDYILDNSESLRNDLLPNEFTTEDVDKKEFSSFRKVFKKASKKKPTLQMDKTYEDDMRASDIEISDTEISSYIRSDEQVKMIMSLKNNST